MTIWARITTTDNKIAELIDYDPTGIFVDDPDYSFQVVPASLEPWVTTQAVATAWVVTGGVFSPISIDTLLAALIAKVEQTRWERQTAGIIVNSSKFLSDPTNLGIISNAILGGQVTESQYGPGSFPPINWKSETGFVTLTLAELIGVGMFGMQYTQGCFNREGTIMAGVHSIANGAGTIEEKTAALIAEYNAQIDTNWPDNSTTTTPPVEEPPAP